MPRQWARVIVLSVSLACLCLPAQAARGGNGGNGGNGGSKGGGSSSGCATMAIALSSSTATAGVSTVGTYGPITNCASRKERYTVVDSLTSACGSSKTMTSGSVTLRAGETQLVSSSHALSADTCPGPATVTRRVYDGGQMLASDSASLTVLSSE